MKQDFIKIYKVLATVNKNNSYTYFIRASVSNSITQIYHINNNFNKTLLVQVGSICIIDRVVVQIKYTNFSGGLKGELQYIVSKLSKIIKVLTVVLQAMGFDVDSSGVKANYIELRVWRTEYTYVKIYN